MAVLVLLNSVCIQESGARFQTAHLRCVCVCGCVHSTGGGMGSLSMDRMGTSFDRMGGGMDMSRGFGGYGGGGGAGHMGGGMSERGSGAKGGCQIFVRNVSTQRKI